MVPMSNKVFIVHGHDGEARETVARFLVILASNRSYFMNRQTVDAR